MNQPSSKGQRDKSEPVSSALAPTGLGFVWPGHVAQAASRAQLPQEWWVTTDEEILRHLKVLSRGLQRGNSESQAPHCLKRCLSSSYGSGLALDLMYSSSLFQILGFLSPKIASSSEVAPSPVVLAPENSLASALLCPPCRALLS